MFVCSDTDHCETRRAEAPHTDVIPGRREASNPESSPRLGKDGFRVPACGRPRNDGTNMSDAFDDIADDTPLLRAEGLSKWYGRQLGCRDVSFDLFPGEVMAVVGESGSGKTTLLQLLSAQLAPSAGRVRYRMRDGIARDLAALGEAERRFLTAPIGATCTRTPRSACAWRCPPAPMSASG